MAAGVPPRYMAVVFFGSGMSGIFCNLLRAITLISFPVRNPKTDVENDFL
jgi:hypothetical protein